MNDAVAQAEREGSRGGGGNGAGAGNRPSLVSEVNEFLRALPNKGLFVALLTVWCGLFHFLGNAVFGYVDTGSLLYWMYYVFSTSSDDAHGLLIPFVVLALLWWKKEQLMRVPKQTWWPALLIVAFALVLHVVGYAVQQSRISIVGFFLGLYGLTGLVWGKVWLQRTFFPMFLFAFCVPLGTMADAITVPLRMLVSKIAVGIAHGPLGIDVIREGSQIFDPKHTFQYDVAAPCSGIRSLIAMLALTMIYGFVSFDSACKRVVMSFSAVPLAIAANVFRVTVVIIVGDAFGQQNGAMIEQKFGFVTFGFAIIAALFVGRLLKGRSETPVLTAQPA